MCVCFVYLYMYMYLILLLNLVTTRTSPTVGRGVIECINGHESLTIAQCILICIHNYVLHLIAC